MSVLWDPGYSERELYSSPKSFLLANLTAILHLCVVCVEFLNSITECNFLQFPHWHSLAENVRAILVPRFYPTYSAIMWPDIIMMMNFKMRCRLKPGRYSSPEWGGNSSPEWGGVAQRFSAAKNALQKAALAAEVHCPAQNLVTTVLLTTLLTVYSAAVTKPHIITFGKWIPVQWTAAINADEEALPMKARALMVDGRVKEYVTGPPHEITERLS